MEHLLQLFNDNRGLRFRLSRELGITHGAISQWRQVPAGRVLDVERITKIPRHELRPDLYPAPVQDAAA
jgi:DNA-binding transcriptional regulator YdaS (Cro superfamily)